MPFGPTALKTMQSAAQSTYEFGEYQLDARRRSLFKNGQRVPLSARNFDLLLFMVENSGRILEHDELLDKVWAGTFVEQATLKKGISALRQILAESAGNEFIKTIPRRGYSFTAPVRAAAAPAAAQQAQTQEVYLVRETGREIIIEEYEGTDEPDDAPNAPEKPLGASLPLTRALPAAHQRRVSFSRLAVLSAAGAAMLLLGYLGWSAVLSKKVPPQFSVENIRVSKLTSDGKSAGAVISPDASYLLYSVNEKESASLYLRQMSTGSTSRLTDTVKGGFWGFAFAPDSSYVYYILHHQDDPRKSGLYKVPLLGGEARQIQEDVSSISISPDGRRIALVRITDQINIFTVNSDGEDERPVSTLPADAMLWGISWAPDSAAVLCTIRKNAGNRPVFYVSEIAAETGQERIVLPAQERIISGAVWLPDKSALLVTMREPNADLRQIWQYFPANADWRRVTNDNNSYKFISLSRDGKSIVTSQESRLATVWAADNLPIDKKTLEQRSLLNGPDSFHQVTDGIGNYDWLGWLADNRIMYSTTDDRQELIYTIGRDGTNPRPITSGTDGIWMFPSVSGTGRSIAYLSNRSGLRQVWRIDDDGRNAAQITRADSPVTKARILSDNATVLYETQQSGTVFLYKQTADGKVSQLTAARTGAFAVSPDETLLATETQDENTGKAEVELRSLTDGRLIRTFDFAPNRELKFTPDGKSLAYDALYKDLIQVMIQPLDGSAPYPLTNFQTDKIFSFAWSPDGAHFAVIRGKQLSDIVLIR